MKDQKARRNSWQRLALSGGFDGVPPGGTPKVASGSGPRRPSLTAKFNAAAKNPQLSSVVSQPVSKQQIEALKRKMSQPRSTLELGMHGSVNKARNPNKDRLIMETITALSEQLGKNQGLKNRFALAANKGELKKTFNKKSKGMGI